MVNNKTLNAIIWKEKVLFFRSTIWLVLFYLLLIELSNIYVLTSYIEIDYIKKNIDNVVFNNLAMLVPTIFVAVGSVILSQSISVEKKEGILIHLIGNGTSAADIWLGKVIYSLLVCYVTLILCIGSYYGMVTILFSITIVFSIKQWILLLFVMPVISSFLLSLYAFLFWISKSQLIQVLYSMLPAVIYLISFYINDYIIGREFEAKVPVLVLICCICLLGIILLSKVVKNYLIEKIL